jgi:hypothetical protein
MLALLIAIAIVSYALIVSSGPAVLLQTYIVGPVGHQLQIAAGPGQSVAHPTVRGPMPNGMVPDATIYSYSLTMPTSGEVKIMVSVAPAAISAARAHRIIFGYFNNTPERLTTWNGLPADSGVRPCSTPAGSCPGYLGGIQVVSRDTLYDVFVDSVNSPETALAVIESFNILA